MIKIIVVQRLINSAAPMMNENIGFMQGRLSDTYQGRIQSFPWSTWDKEFAEGGIHNFRVMEWTIDFEMFDRNPLVTESGREYITYLERKNSLKVESVTCDCFMQVPFWKPEETEFSDLSMKRFKTLVEACSKQKVKYLVLPLVDNGSLTKKRHEECLVETLKKEESNIRNSGVQVIFESDYDPVGILNLMTTLDSSIYGINYDTGNSASMGYDTKEEFEVYHQYIRNIHVKDRLLGGTTVPLGEGNLQIDEVCKQIKRYDYRGNMILQTARSRTNAHAYELTKNRSYLVRALKKYHYIGNNV